MKWLINPFERIAGWQALTIGVIVMALTAIIGKINHIIFSGVLYVNTGATFDFSAGFIMQAVIFLALFLTMWIAGVCFSKTKVRAIDVAGTMALARFPMLLLAIVCFLPIAPASPYDIPRLIVFCLISIPFFVWMVALMYNAYSVSCHLKGGRAIISFIGALVVAHFLSLLIFFFLSSSMFTNIPIKNVFVSKSKENIEVIDSLTIRQKTENVVNALEQGNFDAITVYFDETMKNGLPVSGLRMAWMQTNAMYGKFEKADMSNMTETSMDRYNIVEVPFDFQKEKLKLRLAFNDNGEISGLFFLPI
jgi:hypothetical protein